MCALLYYKSRLIGKPSKPFSELFKRAAICSEQAGRIPPGMPGLTVEPYGDIFGSSAIVERYNETAGNANTLQLDPTPRTLGMRSECTLDETPVHHKAPRHTHSHTTLHIEANWASQSTH